MNSDYYVYALIDPRNSRAFYYGKGRGNRRFSHAAVGHSSKAKTIRSIGKSGREVVSRVIARNLTQEQAYLVEKALIWSNDRLTNISTGHYSEHFRPEDSLYRKLPGFDYRGGLYFLNSGDSGGGGRAWEDCIKFGFVAAGHGKNWSDQIRKLEKGDVVAVLLARHGYVGIGQVVEEAVPAKNFLFRGKPLRAQKLKGTAYFRPRGEDAEYLVRIKWNRTFTRDKAKWKKGLFKTQLIRASLDAQPKTIDFLERNFGVKMGKLLEK